MAYEKKGRYIVEFPDIPSPRQHYIEIDVDERRNNYKEVELGFDEERAAREARRCLSCRRCLGCALCWAECKPEAIHFEMEDEIIELEAREVVITPGVERAVDRVDRRFGLGTHPNVITDLQLERMLSETGPSAGLVICPYDGEIPRRVAFVQGYASAPPPLHRSSLCLAMNEALLLKKKATPPEVSIFATDISATLQPVALPPKGIDGLTLSEAPVQAVEIRENKPTVVFGSDGERGELECDLAVILTQPVISKDLKELTRGLGLSLNYASFLSGATPGPITAERENPYIAPLG